MLNIKKWIPRSSLKPDKEVISDISNTLSINPLTACVLAVRGYDTPEKADKFLTKETTFFHDAFLMNDMDKAVKRIVRAIQNNERITIYGDYDVDGVTSVSALYLYLKKQNADVNYYIPNRFGEGYGMNINAIDSLIEGGTNLIITVDTGITAIEEALYIKEKGLGLIITDHHRCQATLPDAEAIVNPRRPDNTYPFEELAGVGVVFKLLCALEHTINPSENYLKTICREYGDLIAVGTISDVMKLKDENRLICAIGLYNMEKNPRAGIAAIIDQTYDKNQNYQKKRKINTAFVGFTLAPRINAAGRIDDAKLGVELLISEDPENAAKIAAVLCELNTKRQIEENRIATEATEMAELTHDFKNDPVIVLASENWNNGIIGIVSSRLTEKYNMPSILISVENGEGKGSGRSIKGLNLVDALSDTSDLLIRFGGHELAAGLTISTENIDEFRIRINDFARSHLSAEDSLPIITYDCEAEESDINVDIALELLNLEPCGTGNPTPVFIKRNIKLLELLSIGAGKHTKLLLGSADAPITALMFGSPAINSDIEAGDIVDVAFKIDLNEFQNQKNAQMIIMDLRLCEAEIYRMERELEIVKQIENGETFSKKDYILPDRDDFGLIYTALKKLCEKTEYLSLYKIYRYITQNKISDTIPRMAKIKLALKIFADVGLVAFEELPYAAMSGSELYKISVPQVNGKVNLFGIPRYKNLKKQLKN